MRKEEQDGHRPDYQNYYPYQNYYDQQGNRKKKKRTGLLVVLVILVLMTGAVSWAVNVLGMHVELGDRGMTISLGDAEQEKIWQQEEPETPEDAVVQPPEETQNQPVQNPEPEQEEMPETKPEEDRPENQNGLVIEESPESVENIPSSQADALSLQEIYAKVYPSVASISCVMDNGTGSGTGIVMSADGYVITNYHVIEGAKRIYVLIGDDDQYVASLVGGDEATDLAVLKVESDDLQPAEFGDSDALRVGDTVVAIGDPLGAELRGTMTDGIVSAINRDLNLDGRQMTLIQTNAALNSGNSGGPLINCYGQVIGINTMKMSSYSSTSATVEGLGFAIPINSAKIILDELMEQGYVSGRPALGVEAETLDIRAQFFYQLPSGVIVTAVLPESDAAEKGLEEDDVIVAVNDIRITSLEDLVGVKNDLQAGDTVTLTIYREGKYYYVEVVLMDQISPEIY